MKTHQFRFSNIDELVAWSPPAYLADTTGLFLQCYCGDARAIVIDAIQRWFTTHFRLAQMIGATTSGEIFLGKTSNSGIVLVFYIFTSSRCRTAFREHSCIEGWEESGLALGNELAHSDPRALILLSTGLGNCGDALLRGLTKALPNVPVAGGSAGDNLAFETTWVFDHVQMTTNGVVAAMLHGEHLNVVLSSTVDWRPIGPALTVTAAEKNRLKSLDHVPTLEVFKHYLGEEVAQLLPAAGIEFPLLYEQNDVQVLRAAFGWDTDGSAILLGELPVGAEVHFAIGDPILMISSVRKLFDDLRTETWDAIQVFSCAARLAMMGQHAVSEPVPFQLLAPTSGYWCYGEYTNAAGKNHFLNFSFTVLALRETDVRTNLTRPEWPVQEFSKVDLVSKAIQSTGLAHLVHVTTQQLEEARRQMELLAMTDALTGLPNRRHMQELLLTESTFVKRGKTPFSIAIIDVDRFKAINDTYGHQSGDLVLKELADILRTAIRPYDTVGRWGGEEFLLILRDTDRVQAEEVAHRLCRAVRNSCFAPVPTVTVSLGIATFEIKLTVDILINRADKALYEAKRLGRDRAICYSSSQMTAPTTMDLS